MIKGRKRLDEKSKTIFTGIKITQDMHDKITVIQHELKFNSFASVIRAAINMFISEYKKQENMALTIEEIKKDPSEYIMELKQET